MPLDRSEKAEKIRAESKDPQNLPLAIVRGSGLQERIF